MMMSRSFPGIWIYYKQKWQKICHHHNHFEHPLHAETYIPLYRQHVNCSYEKATMPFAIDKDNFHLASGPDVITRGFIYARENENLINEIKEISRQKIEECLDDKSTQWQVLKTSVRKSVELLLFEKTKRRPSVFPIIMDV